MARSKAIQFIINTNRIFGKCWEFGMSLTYWRIFKKMYKDSRAQFNYKSYDKAGLKAYKKKWAPLGFAHPVYFKLYSQFVGSDPNILPDDLSHKAIESILNPVKFRAPYEDKNMFDKILGYEMTAKTLLRSMQGFLYDQTYKPVSTDVDLNKLIKGYQRVVAKQTLETCSGDDVLVFEQDSNSRWIQIGNPSNELTLDLLKNRLGSDWLLQEYLKQSEFMNSLCKTSVNTLRILVYRSVKDDVPHVLNAGIRIGHDGAIVDNSHQGGLFVGLDKNGRLNHWLTDQYLLKYTVHNDIDFSTVNLQVPDWAKIIAFSEEVARRIPYHRCLNLDVMIDFEGNPKIIEYNIGTMSMWLFQSHLYSCFGEYTDEIIEYCAAHKEENMSKYLFV